MIVKNTRATVNTAIAIANHFIHGESFMRKDNGQIVCCQNQATAAHEQLRVADCVV
jgi:hypothetical protein